MEEVDVQPSAAPAPPSAHLAGVDAAALEATILHTVCCVLYCNDHSDGQVVRLYSHQRTGMLMGPIKAEGRNMSSVLPLCTLECYIVNDKFVALLQVRELVGGEVAPDEPLAAQGLDSLAGMELRQKLQVHTLPLLLPLLLLLLLLLLLRLPPPSYLDLHIFKD